MKTTLYWFSATGNTLKAARLLAETLGDCELKPIMRELRHERIVLTGERVGLCFPLFFLSFPKPVMDFLARMENPTALPLFSVVTRGFAPMGGVRWPLRKACRLAGTELTGLYYLDLPNNDLTLFKPDPEAVAASRLANLPAGVDRIAASLASGRKRFDAEPLGWVRPFRHKPCYVDRLASFGRSFRADDSCVGCGICESVCPAGNVRLEGGRPVWGDGCVLCEGCLNWCPKRAIQFGGVTAAKGRYTCPGISANDISLQRRDQEPMDR